LDLSGRQQSHSINQCQVRHSGSVASHPDSKRFPTTIKKLSRWCSTIRLVRLLPIILAASCIAAGQNSQEPEKKSEQNPPVKVNLLNVCTPNAEEQQQLKSTLAHLPKSPSFVTDYEISRGVSTVQEGNTAKYVRLRREFKSDS